MKSFKGSLSKILTKFNINIFNFIEKNKIKTYIKTLNNKNEVIYNELGKKLYEKYLQDDYDISHFYEYLENIKINNQLIIEQHQKIINLELEKCEILGIPAEKLGNTQYTKNKICKNCGFENSLENKFCIRCGNKF